MNGPVKRTWVKKPFRHECIRHECIMKITQLSFIGENHHHRPMLLANGERFMLSAVAAFQLPDQSM